MSEKHNIIYNAQGEVYGRTWSISKGTYKARSYSGYESKEALIKQIEVDFADNSLDDGYGFESLIGARMTIVEVDSMVYNNKTYVAHEYDEVILGEFPEELYEGEYDDEC